MIKEYCDRCGKELKKYAYRFPLSIEEIPMYVISWGTRGKAVLCLDCNKSFEKWINENGGVCRK
jgi:hypothetical protein